MLQRGSTYTKVPEWAIRSQLGRRTCSGSYFVASSGSAMRGPQTGEKTTAAMGIETGLFLSFDFIDHDRRRSSAFKHLPTSANFLPGEGQEFVVLAAGRSGVGDGPIDRPAVRQNHQGRTGLSARDRTLGADGFLQPLGESTCRIQHVALDCNGLAGVGAPCENPNDQSGRQGHLYSIAKSHRFILSKKMSTYSMRCDFAWKYHKTTMVSADVRLDLFRPEYNAC